MKIEYEETDDDDEDEEDEEKLEEYKELIRKKTDRELMENIALRLVLLEKNVKEMQDDLVDTYNLILEGSSDEDDEEED